MVDSELCEVYGWTWQQCRDTPHYVRIVFYQIQQMKRLKQAQDAERAEAERDGRQVISYA